jgi:sulfur relay (sulfurtransferase) DsrC/TusE family protein
MHYPSMHEPLKTLGKHHGKRSEEAKKYRDFLYRHFPQGPVPMLCKLAGLVKPDGETED